jgi:hypothetical protein
MGKMTFCCSVVLLTREAPSFVTLVSLNCRITRYVSKMSHIIPHEIFYSTKVKNNEII